MRYVLVAVWTGLGPHGAFNRLVLAQDEVRDVLTTLSALGLSILAQLLMLLKREREGESVCVCVCVRVCVCVCVCDGHMHSVCTKVVNSVCIVYDNINLLSDHMSE